VAPGDVPSPDRRNGSRKQATRSPQQAVINFGPRQRSGYGGIANDVRNRACGYRRCIAGFCEAPGRVPRGPQGAHLTGLGGVGAGMLRARRRGETTGLGGFIIAKKAMNAWCRSMTCRAGQLRWSGLEHRHHAGRLRQVIASDFEKRATSLGMGRAGRALEASLRHHQIEKRRFPPTAMDRLA
jgi:hypothetical protein